MSDPIHNLTAELEQLFMQDDFDGAKYALEKFVQQRDGEASCNMEEGFEQAWQMIQDLQRRLGEKEEETIRLRKSNARLRSQLNSANSAANRMSRYDEDYVPYPDEDYRD